MLYSKILQATRKLKALKLFQLSTNNNNLLGPVEHGCRL